MNDVVLNVFVEGDKSCRMLPNNVRWTLFFVQNAGSTQSDHIKTTKETTNQRLPSNQN